MERILKRVANRGKVQRLGNRKFCANTYFYRNYHLWNSLLVSCFEVNFDLQNFTWNIDLYLLYLIPVLLLFSLQGNIPLQENNQVYKRSDKCLCSDTFPRWWTRSSLHLLFLFSSHAMGYLLLYVFLRCLTVNASPL